jgi:DNA end-binding protein Ku
MPNYLWGGSLSFGLVNVPVALFSAVHDHRVRFRQLHEPDGSPIEIHRICAEEKHRVPWSQIVKGYELEDGRWVLLNEEDLEAASPRRSKTIEIERFVSEAEVDPLYYESHYSLAPREEGAERAYRLLSEAMSRSGRVALGRFVMRARESLVSVRSRDGGLVLSTMRFHDEVRSTDEIAAQLGGVRAGRAEVQSAMAVIEELSVDFEPESYEDEHRAHVLAVIEQKRKGGTISVPTQEREEEPTETPDLMRALEESIARARDEGREEARPRGTRSRQGSTGHGSAPLRPAARRRRG